MRRKICRDTRYKVFSAFLIFMLVMPMLFLAGCRTQKITAQAVYLLPESGGQLKGLEDHPEIVAVHTFDDLKKTVEKAIKNSTDDAAGKGKKSADKDGSPAISIWVDKDAADQFDSAWFQEEPQSNLPLVLIGYNDALYSFRETLSLPGIEGPFVDWNLKTLEPGFSIWILQERTESSEKSWMKGYDTEPTVESILSAEQSLMQDSTTSDKQ